MIRDVSEAPQPAAGNIDYNKILSTVLSRWYWIAGCVLIGLALAWVYLSLKHPQYRASASVMLKERSSDVSNILNADASDKSSLETFNLTQAATFIIQSDVFLNKAVSKLNYRYSFYDKDKWSYDELYPETPFKINIIRQDTVGFFSGMFRIVAIGGGKFTLSNPDDPQSTEVTHRYRDVIKAPGIVFSIVSSSSVVGDEHYFRFHTKESLVARTARGLQINAQNQNILEIIHEDGNPTFAADVLNAIADEYIVYESAQRNLSATQRLAFINQQLDILGKKVDSIGNELDSVKKRNNITDGLPMKIQTDIQRLAQYEGQKATLDIEKLNIDQLEQQAMSNGTRLTINFNLQGQVDGMLAGLISQYNSQLDQRDQLLVKYEPGSDPLKQVEKKIPELRTAILYNIRQMAERNLDRMGYFNEKIAESRAALNDAPSAAKDYIRFQAEYDINKKILSNFTEEKYKSQIEQAAIAPGASIIYYASPSGIPVSPIANRIYAMAIVGGAGAGVFFILLARYLNQRLRDVGSVLLLSNIPVLGLIRRSAKKYHSETAIQVAYFAQPDSIFAESVRKLRNSLVFVTERSKAKVICISSEVSGEGRTFAIINLAASLAQLNKKVIVIDADLRKPSLDKAISTEELGLSAYLINYNSLLSVIRRTDIPNLDIIPSGVAPANAPELLISPKMKELLAYLRNIYDYVLVDTSPVGTFADAIPLLEKADLNIFVLRSGVSGYKSVPLLEKLIADYQLNNFYLLLNAFRKNPLYQPFDAKVVTDVYFDTDYAGYTRKNHADSDDLKWDSLNRESR